MGFSTKNPFAYSSFQVNGRWVMSGPSAVLVDASSATHGRHWESRHPFIYPVNRSHSDMVKFTGSDDHVYRVVLERLRLLEAGARKIIPQRHMNKTKSKRPVTFLSINSLIEEGFVVTRSQEEQGRYRRA